jgi:hypothetical protein
MANCCEEPVAPFNPSEEIEASTRVVTLERRSQAASFNIACCRGDPCGRPARAPHLPEQGDHKGRPYIPRVGAMTSQKWFTMIGTSWRTPEG